jgi:hypothetical protein
VEALQFKTTTQSHWSRGSTVCFPSRGSAFRIPGDAQVHNGTGFLLLALSCYSPLIILHWKLFIEISIAKFTFEMNICMDTAKDKDMDMDADTDMHTDTDIDIDIDIDIDTKTDNDMDMDTVMCNVFIDTQKTLIFSAMLGG